MKLPRTANDDHPGPTGRRQSWTGGDLAQSVSIVTPRMTPSRAGPRKPGHTGPLVASAAVAGAAGVALPAVADAAGAAGASTAGAAVMVAGAPPACGAPGPAGVPPESASTA